MCLFSFLYGEVQLTTERAVRGAYSVSSVRMKQTGCALSRSKNPPSLNPQHQCLRSASCLQLENLSEHYLSKPIIVCSRTCVLLRAKQPVVEAHSFDTEHWIVSSHRNAPSAATWLSEKNSTQNHQKETDKTMYNQKKVDCMCCEGFENASSRIRLGPGQMSLDLNSPRRDH